MVPRDRTYRQDFNTLKPSVQNRKRNVQEFQNTPVNEGLGSDMSTTARKQSCRLGEGVKRTCLEERVFSQSTALRAEPAL